jgi:3-oxoadipate enol-lactonase
MQQKTGFADVNGTRLYYEIAGSGHPLVLIHGNTLDTRMWDDQFEVFAQQYRVLRYDVRGFGQSALPTTGPYAHNADLRALLTFLHIDHAFILGLSMGGGIAIDFAVTYPDATDALIPVDAVLGGYQMAQGNPSDGARAHAGQAGIPAGKRLWLQHPLFAPAYEHPTVAVRLTQMVETYSGWHFVNANPVRRTEPPAIQQLDTMRVPTLIVVGERDLFDFHHIAETLARRIPGAKKVVMPGVGHMANMEDPQGFNALILEFLAEQ